MYIYIYAYICIIGLAVFSPTDAALSAFVTNLQTHRLEHEHTDMIAISRHDLTNARTRTH